MEHSRLDAKLPEGQRILLLGEHLGRIRQLAEALIRAGARVELVALPRHLTEADFSSDAYSFTLVDATSLGRASVELLESLRRSDQTVPMIAVVRRNATRHRLTGTPCVPACIDADDRFTDIAAITESVLGTWGAVRPLFGPGELRVDRLIQRVSLRGRVLALRPVDFRLLALLAERGAAGATIDELVRCAWSGRQLGTRRAATMARQGLERVRSALRRAGIGIGSDSDGRYRLTDRSRTTRT